MNPESLMIEDEKAMHQMSKALDALRLQGPPADKADKPALMGPKAFFLDRRQITHVARGGGSGVVWPRAPAGARR